MAKSSAEQIRDLNSEIAVLCDRDAARERDLTELKNEPNAERDARHRLELEFAAIKQQLQEQVKKADQTDARRWAVIALVIGALFSLASGLIVSLTRK